MNQTHPTEARAGAMLQNVAGLSAKADASAKALKDGAAKRMVVVTKRMEELRPQVLLSSDAASEYQELVVERYRLGLASS